MVRKNADRREWKIQINLLHRQRTEQFLGMAAVGCKTDSTRFFYFFGGLNAMEKREDFCDVTLLPPPTDKPTVSLS
jgi:hypothetical protein